MSVMEKHLSRYFAARKEIEAYSNHIDDQMAAYEQAEESRRGDIYEQRVFVDADGFATAVAKSSRLFTSPEEAAEQELLAKRSMERRERKNIKGFYNIRGSGDVLRREQVDELKKRFESDKKKLDDLKAARIFHPLG